MIDRMKTCALLVLVAIVGPGLAAQADAQEAVWRVTKVSGDVAVVSPASRVALTSGAIVNPGDSVRTGQNGRVLLVRGQETILLSPNSTIGIPKAQADGLSTTIVQQAGSILLEVEKRNVRHFQVETPYLAAVVKGTQFRVTVDDSGANVDVLRGQVEVTDFKTGQYALVEANQAATVSVQGPAGLALSGAGTLSPVQQGTPRSPSFAPAPSAAPAPAIREAVAVPPGTQTEQPGRLWPTQPAAVEPLPPPPRGNTSFESVWSSTVASLRSYLGIGSARRDRNEDITFALAFAGAVGFAVSVGVSARRRWRRRK